VPATTRITPARCLRSIMIPPMRVISRTTTRIPRKIQSPASLPFAMSARDQMMARTPTVTTSP